MDDHDFDGTDVLERLAAIGRLEEFAEAVDAGDFDAARTLLRAAGLNARVVAEVLARMADPDNEP